MRTERKRIAAWWWLLVAVLAMSGCTDGPSTRPKTPIGPDWVSVKTTLDLRDLVMERVTYQSGGLTIFGQVCRPGDPGPHPVIIFNHGGFGGLPDWEDPNGFCGQAAKLGWAVAESSYRGEDGSGGDVEACLGEVDDVMAMLDVMRTQTYADPDRVAMFGVSHGGCVTTKAVERGADVDAAIDVAGPANWGPLMKDVDRAAKAPTTNPRLKQIYQSILKVVHQAVGGAPDQFPERYAERSPDPEKIAQWDKPLLIMHGGADTIVPVQQSCRLVSKTGDFRAHRFDPQGGDVAQAPPGCEGITWSDSPGDAVDFEGDRYLLVYDQVDHFLVDNNGLTRMMKDLFRFLEAKLPAD
jgi:pimeloyl-ACP methyl ester carboxylesterase